MKKNPKTVAGLAVLAILIVVLGVLTAGTVDTAGKVIYQQSLTPTPLPSYGNVMAVTPDPSSPTLPPPMRNGSTGQRVTELQTRLYELGYYSGAIDGQYGNETKNAVLAFQQANNLDTDGIAGAETCDALYGDEAVPAPQQQ